MSLPNNTTALNALLSAVNALPEKIDTSGTAVAADIYTGKTATVNDVRITGSNPYNAANVEPAVANALAELAEKGVDTAGAGLADIAGLIASIEAGGGGYFQTDFIPANDVMGSTTTGVEIEHNLGKMPVAIFTLRKGATGAVRYEIFFQGLFAAGTDSYAIQVYHNYSTTASGISDVSGAEVAAGAADTLDGAVNFNTIRSPYTRISETSVTLIGQSNYSYARLKAGVTYTLVVM